MANIKKKIQEKPSLEAFQEEVRKIAENNYRKRIASNEPGDELSDWLQAETAAKKKFGM
jgi:hypothetical protein